MTWGAPQVITNPNQQIYTSDPVTDQVAQQIRSKQIIQQIPVWEPAYQFSVPPVAYNRGWTAPDIAPVPGPTFTKTLSAPPVQYINKSYSQLVANSVNPPAVQNRPVTQVSAPPIVTTYGS